MAEPPAPAQTRCLPKRSSLCPEDQFALPLVDEMLAEWHTSLVVDILHNQDWRACSYSQGIKAYYRAHGKIELETEWQFGEVPAVLPA